MFYICPFVCLSVRPKLVQFQNSAHKWSTGQGHEIIKAPQVSK